MPSRHAMAHASFTPRKRCKNDTDSQLIRALDGFMRNKVQGNQWKCAMWSFRHNRTILYLITLYQIHIFQFCWELKQYLVWKAGENERWWIVHFIILGFQSVEGLSTSLTGPDLEPDLIFLLFKLSKNQKLSNQQHCYGRKTQKTNIYSNARWSREASFPFTSEVLCWSTYDSCPNGGKASWCRIKLL